MQISLKLKPELPTDPALLLWGTYPKELKLAPQRDDPHARVYFSMSLNSRGMLAT